MDAIDHDVPTPAITASLYARFYSRDDGDYTHRVLAALRNQFGGHAVERATQGVTMAVAEQQEQNPLVEGLERLPVPPTALVIFGATGDLAHRKLLPALYNLAHEGALPERFKLIGVARREKGHDNFREECRASICEYSRRDARRRGAQRPARARAVRRVELRRPERLRPARRRSLDKLDQEAGPAAQPRLLPVDGAGVLPGDHRAAQGRRPAPPQAGGRALHHREALRHRPATRAQAAEGRRQRVPRAPGLPHRPLPGQGDGPERHGVPVREHDVRARLEPELHRPHPDHGRRGHRHRHARRLLRRGGRAARPRAEPHAAARRADLHGAAGDVRGRPGARREGQGPHRDPAARRRTRRSARSTRRARSAGRRPRATSRRRACPRARTPRPTRRSSSRSTTGAGRACRSSCAPASGWRARSRRSRCSSSRCRTSRSSPRARSACSPTS